MSFHLHVDRDGVRTAHDLDADDQHPADCARIIIGPGTSRLAALRWLGQALKAVGEGYDLAAGNAEQLAASGEPQEADRIESEQRAAGWQAANPRRMTQRAPKKATPPAAE